MTTSPPATELAAVSLVTGVLPAEASLDAGDSATRPASVLETRVERSADATRADRRAVVVCAATRRVTADCVCDTLTARDVVAAAGA